MRLDRPLRVEVRSVRGKWHGRPMPTSLPGSPGWGFYASGGGLARPQLVVPVRIGSCRNSLAIAALDEKQQKVLVGLTAVPYLPHPLPNLRVLLQVDPIQLLELRLVGRIPVRRTRWHPPPSTIPRESFERPQRRRLRLRLPPRTSKPLQLPKGVRVDVPVTRHQRAVSGRGQFLPSFLQAESPGGLRPRACRSRTLPSPLARLDSLDLRVYATHHIASSPAAALDLPRGPR
jgi:hypothetical protein